MPGSATALGRAGARNSAPARVAFRQQNDVGTQKKADFAAQWLAYAIPYRRFAEVLADNCARLGADVVCYSFTVADFSPPTPCRSPGALWNRPRRKRA